VFGSPLPLPKLLNYFFNKGTLTPLLGIGVCVSIQFGALEYAKRIFASQNLAVGRGGEGGKSLTSQQLFISGVFAGVSNGVVSGPVEHIRIRESYDYSVPGNHPNFSPGLQTQSNTNPLYNGPWDAIKKIYGQRGIAGIYKGQAVTLLREATGYGVYFLTYEKLVQWEMAKKGIRRDQINPANSIMYGAAAGYAVSSFVSLSFPIIILC
jgi:solute carrier family 25 carnitine/acylcarnitine transporter 20/29